jgi:hypothetical protein
MMVHAVFFWLRPGLTDAQRSSFRAEVARLAAARTVGTIYVGGPAPTPEREVTEKGFDLALTIIFKDTAAHDAYQVDPVHLAFVERNRHLWTRVQVFDSQE